MTAKLLNDYDCFKGYIQRHSSEIDHDLKAVYGVQYPIEDIDRLQLVLNDNQLRAQALREKVII
jgi:hypothetical protein